MYCCNTKTVGIYPENTRQALVLVRVTFQFRRVTELLTRRCLYLHQELKSAIASLTLVIAYRAPV
jgi:hypothetical protein